MARLVLLVFLLATDAAALLAANSPELLVAIRNGDHAQAEKLLRAGAGYLHR